MDGLLIGFTSVSWQQGVMYLVGAALIILAVTKEYEPMLLLPIGFGAILVNLPLSVVWEHEGAAGFLKVLYDGGISNELFPILIFIAVG
ncbi:MAG TPA: sodium ion-translocating decarboxylase subunit beta, partial [Spirochaetales bacterium]|nr:sodium ion-translocating decarboxylase subunit beta [Spirochaetales bacterium]